MYKRQAQHEIDFQYGDVLRSADNIMTFKMAAKTIAKRHGLHATFMPKPKAVSYTHPDVYKRQGLRSAGPVAAAG